MIILPAAGTLVAGASAAAVVTVTVFGMELTSGPTQTYKKLFQGQLGSSPATIYTAPASTQVFIRSMSIVNTDTVSRTFQFCVNGTANANKISPLFTLLPGYTASYEDGMGWRFYNTIGEQSVRYGTFSLLQDYGIANSIAETMDRNICTETNTALLSTGRLSLQAIWLTADMRINSISFFSQTTAAGTPTNQIFGIYAITRQLLAQSVNDTTTAWGVNSIKTLALPSTLRIEYTGLHYVGIMVVATTVPSLKGNTATTGGQLHGQQPILNGTSNTGLTTSLPNPATVLTVATTSAWASVNE